MKTEMKVLLVTAEHLAHCTPWTIKMCHFLFTITFANSNNFNNYFTLVFWNQLWRNLILDIKPADWHQICCHTIRWWNLTLQLYIKCLPMMSSPQCVFSLHLAHTHCGAVHTTGQWMQLWHVLQCHSKHLTGRSMLNKLIYAKKINLSNRNACWFVIWNRNLGLCVTLCRLFWLMWMKSYTVEHSDIARYCSDRFEARW